MSAAYYDEEEEDAFWDYDSSGLEDIKANEGAFIAAYLQHHGHLPRWNKIGGARHSRGQAGPRFYLQLELAVGLIDSLLLARKTIRELSDDPTSMAYEEALHAGRQSAILKTFGTGVDSLVVVKSLVETTIPASTMRVIIAHFARHAGLALGPTILMQVRFLLCELVIRENPRGMQLRELPDLLRKRTCQLA